MSWWWILTDSNKVWLSYKVTYNLGQRGKAIHMLNVGAKKRKQPERSSYNQVKLGVQLN